MYSCAVSRKDCGGKPPSLVPQRRARQTGENTNQQPAATTRGVHSVTSNHGMPNDATPLRLPKPSSSRDAAERSWRGMKPAGPRLFLQFRAERLRESPADVPRLEFFPTHSG